MPTYPELFLTAARLCSHVCATYVCVHIRKRARLRETNEAATGGNLPLVPVIVYTYRYSDLREERYKLRRTLLHREGGGGGGGLLHGDEKTMEIEYQ